MLLSVNATNLVAYLAVSQATTLGVKLGSWVALLIHNLPERDTRTKEQFSRMFYVFQECLCLECVCSISVAMEGCCTELCVQGCLGRFCAQINSTFVACLAPSGSAGDIP